MRVFAIVFVLCIIGAGVLRAAPPRGFVPMENGLPVRPWQTPILGLYAVGPVKVGEVYPIGASSRIRIDALAKDEVAVTFFAPANLGGTLLGADQVPATLLRQTIVSSNVGAICSGNGDRYCFTTKGQVR